MPTTMIPGDELALRYQQGASCRELAEYYGVTRQAISYRLIRLGFKPNAKRLAKAKARRDKVAATSKAAKETRASNYARALELMTAIADEYNVSPKTLGLYATKSGPYAVAREAKRKDARLPPRHSAEGELLAARCYLAADPYNPHYVTDGGAPVRLERTRRSRA